MIKYLKITKTQAKMNNETIAPKTVL